MKKTRRDDPESFYIMEQKVTNGLFGEFARPSGATGEGDAVDLGGAGVRRRLGEHEREASGVPHDRGRGRALLPMARRALPSGPQWDKAAGCTTIPIGPGLTREPGKRPARPTSA